MFILIHGGTKKLPFHFHLSRLQLAAIRHHHLPQGMCGTTQKENKTIGTTEKATNNRRKQFEEK